uniref:Uncharacterized protein n=1 Tax=Rhizophora mucronata TaxID=61149 RepID=A0A2P2N9H3_RHIMU
MPFISHLKKDIDLKRVQLLLKPALLDVCCGIPLGCFPYGKIHIFMASEEFHSE